VKFYTVEELAEITDKMSHGLKAAQGCLSESERQSMLETMFAKATIVEGALLAVALKIDRAKFAANIDVNMEAICRYLNLLEVIGIDTSRVAAELNLDGCEDLIEEFTKTAAKLVAAIKGR
jgi:hypothetical protein